ncbi:MAG: hypothetical protein M1816_000883 [Peltula sp. TS41687]|nr:MAG: hypothetical protein M1816_000883 [Peltula sp. TS41687]
MGERKGPKTTKLPVQQLIILALCRLAEPIALTSVFPYLPEMMEFLGINTQQVAFYAGLTSAIFSVCQALTGVGWGYASDRLGRKPVILIGLTCTMITSLLFGFSRSLAWAMITRGLAGLGSGNVGIIRTTVAEIVPQRDLQPRAFSIMPLVWAVGSVFGPALGGILANPAKTHPELFGDNHFFQRFPYALPNMVASSLFLLGLGAGVFFLRESLEARKHRRDYGLMVGKKVMCLFKRRRGRPYQVASDRETTSLLSNGETLSSSSSSSGAEDLDAEQLSAYHQRPGRVTSHVGYRDVFTSQSSINLVAYTLLALHSQAFEQLLPVFMHHPQREHRSSSSISSRLKFSGGFGITSQEIGFIFTLYGITGMLAQFFIFPAVARRFGILRCFKVCAIIFPLVYLLTPFTALVDGQRRQEQVLFALMMVKSVAAVFAFPCSTILLTNSAVSLEILGTLNGVATSTSALGRAAGPAIGGWSFTKGVAAGYVIIPWWTIATLAFLSIIPVWFLVENDGPEMESKGSDFEREDDAVDSNDSD